MSRFYVGQRVKVIGRPSVSYAGRPHPAGRLQVGETGTIVGTPNEPNAGFSVNGIWDVSLLLDRHPTCGMAPSSCLAPLTDSYEKTEWKDCAWKPDHMREAV